MLVEYWMECVQLLLVFAKTLSGRVLLATELALQSASMSSEVAIKMVLLVEKLGTQMTAEVVAGMFPLVSIQV